MTFNGRSIDDMPLAAYGGSGMELTPDDEARLDTAAHVDDPATGTTHPAAGATHPAAGPFAHAEPGAALPDDNFGAGRPAAAPRGLPPAVLKVVTTLRTSRPAAGAAFVGVIVVGLMLLNGNAAKPAVATASPSPTAAPVVVATAEPGNATLVLTGKVKRELTFAAMSGSGAPSAPLSVTWTDAVFNTLALNGPVDRGTRTTDGSLVLTFTIAVNDAMVTFTSDDGECTIGMAVNPRNVSGSFSCKNLRSDDGKLTVGASGTYRT